jgi:23S rRNA C2498 (ribose-2'-O)-methylase RlmM
MLQIRKFTEKRNLRIMMVSLCGQWVVQKLMIDFSPEKASSEIQFLQLVAVFVGAIRCGVLDSDHAKEPLAHCGRFGATYDAVVKKLVDVLRDEGIYNRDSDTVVAISVEALQAVSYLCL